MNDSIIFDDMVRVLSDRTTERFRWVDWGPLDMAAPNEGIVARILRTGFNRDERLGNPDEEERRVLYQVVLTVYGADPDRRKKRILNYEAIIINSFHHQRLGGATIPARTLLQVGKDDYKVDPGMSRVILEGSFVYIVPNRGGLTLVEP